MPFLLVLLSLFLPSGFDFGRSIPLSSVSAQTGPGDIAPEPVATAPRATPATVNAQVAPTPLPTVDVTQKVVSASAKTKSGSPVCEALKRYPYASTEKMSFEIGELSPMCKPFVKAARGDLDRCGDQNKDPYTATSSSTTFSLETLLETRPLAIERSAPKSCEPAAEESHVHGIPGPDSLPSDLHLSVSGVTSSDFTWASRNEMARKGKANLFTDAEFQPQIPTLMNRIGELRSSSAQLCCGSDESCKKDFEKVEVTLCKPKDDPNAPDPCVFGGSYKMPGSGYNSIFRAIERRYGSIQSAELKRLAEKNLRAIAGTDPSPGGVTSGNIVLSSYVSRSQGISSLEPVILHEFGHACSMIKMQHQALSGKETELASTTKALRAAQWLDRARQRCSTDLELPEAYYDFWESMGESRSLAQCLFNLTSLNQKQQIDRPCSGLCPGHYMEESVGVAFSMLLGDLSGAPGAAYPNTCDHVRDGQHPMVSDVIECLTQHSPRFRDRLRRTYDCQ